MSKALLIRGQEAGINSTQLRNAGFSNVDSFEGQVYSQTMSALSRSGVYDAIIWPGHGGLDGPNFQRDETVEIKASQTGNVGTLTFCRIGQPNDVSTYTYTITQVTSLLTDSWLTHLNQALGTNLQMGESQSWAHGIPHPDAGDSVSDWDVRLALEEWSEQSYGRKVERNSHYHSRDDGPHDVVCKFANQFQQHTKQGGFIYLGSCNAGTSWTDDDGDIIHESFAQHIANNSMRTTLAAPNSTGAPATQTNLSRILNRGDRDLCNVRLQDNVHCYNPGE